MVATAIIAPTSSCHIYLGAGIARFGPRPLHDPLGRNRRDWRTVPRDNCVVAILADRASGRAAVASVRRRYTVVREGVNQPLCGIVATGFRSRGECRGAGSVPAGCRCRRRRYPASAKGWTSERRCRGRPARTWPSATAITTAMLSPTRVCIRAWPHTKWRSKPKAGSHSAAC